MSVLLVSPPHWTLQMPHLGVAALAGYLIWLKTPTLGDLLDRYPADRQLEALELIGEPCDGGLLEWPTPCPGYPRRHLQRGGGGRPDAASE